MMTNIVRFKDSATEPNNSASCRFDVQSAPCEANEDLPVYDLLKAASCKCTKTSEFAFFNKLKQDVGHTSRLNPQNRTGCFVRKFGPSSHARERGNSKFEDIKSSKKSTADEIGSFLTQNNRPLKHSATPSKEHDSGRFNSASPLKTPTNISLDSFLSSTANASIKPERQQIEEDVFSSKRQKLLQHIARTFFPETSELPTECNLVTLLLSRLLPECSQETMNYVQQLSQNLPSKQPEPEEKIYSNLDSNIRLKETMDTSRKVVNGHEDNFSHTIDFDAQIPRYMKTLPSGQTVEANTVTDDILSNRTHFLQKEGSEHGGFLNRNFWTLGNELYGYSNSNSSSPEILTDGPCMFSYDTDGSGESSKFRDCSHSYEVLDGSCNSLTAANSGSLCMIQDFNPDRRAQLSQKCWFDFSSCDSFKRFRPSALYNLRDYTEPNDFEITRELSPLLLGWNPNKSDIRESTHTSHMELELYRPPSSIGIQDHWDVMELDIYRPPLSTRNEDHWDPNKSVISDCDSTHAIHMELEIYCPPSSTSSQDHWDSPDHDIYRPPSTAQDHWGNLENGSLMHLSPNTYNDNGVQGHHEQEKVSVPISPRVPYMISYGPDSEELSPVDSSSKFFTVPQVSCSSLETMMCERNYSSAEAFISKDSEFDFGLKYKSLTGFLRGQYDSYTDDLHDELLGRKKSIPQLLFDGAKNLTISHPEERFFMNECTRMGEEFSFPLLLDTQNWRGTAPQTYDDKSEATVTFW